MKIMRLLLIILKKSITNKTKVVSLAYVTNVVGDERPIKEISKIAHDNNIFSSSRCCSGVFLIRRLMFKKMI